MKLESVKVALPSRKLTNEDVVDLIKQYSELTYKGKLDRALEQVLFYLKYSGAQYRYWLGEGETQFNLLAQAVHEALAETGYELQDIDLLIYTGVDRGFLEPAGSYLAAISLGMDRVHCFDILDACMSWSRGLYLAYNLFKAGAYRRAMIVNAEFNMREGGAIYPKIFGLHSSDAIEWSFPGYTLGEAATATIVSADSEREWSFYFSSRPDLADLCTIPKQGYEGYYSHPSNRMGRNGAGYFTSFGNELHTNAMPELINVFNRLEIPADEIKAVFTHASSKKAWDDAGKGAGIQHLIWHVYPNYGNVVSASVPTGLASAINAGHIQRGDRIVGWVGSAGMSFCAYSCTY